MNKNTDKNISDFIDEDTIYKEMVRIISLHEIKVYQSRVDRVNSRMQRYFNSTPLKNVFARVCNYAFSVNEFYTIASVARELRSTRQAISTIVDECESEGWLNIRRSPNRVEFQASETLFKSWRDYIDARTSLMSKVEHDEWINLLKVYKDFKRGSSVVV